jgi:thiamine-monophosphate kinase
LASLVLPPELQDDELEALARGQQLASTEVGTQVIGGNLSAGSKLAIHTTVLGTVATPLTRAGAQVGDSLFVAGDLGLAGAGRQQLSEGKVEPVAWVKAWRRPRARIAEGLVAREHATAAIDVSDGLGADARHLAAASGVGVVLECDRLVTPGDGLGDDAIEQILFGGEDYALLVTSPEPMVGFRKVGFVERGSGVWLQRAGGREPLPSGGWDHFASAPRQ